LKGLLRDLGGDENNIKMNQKQDIRVWIGFIWLKIGSTGHGNETSDSIKDK
jgi:hypothetical protein